MTASYPIDLPFTRASVELVLRHGADPDSSPYTHKEIAEWCDRFWCRYLDVDAEEEIEQLLPVLTDVETQWDLYLANKHSVEELRSKSFDDERMPSEWFVEWLDQINR
jgi:hypothetical protein